MIIRALLLASIILSLVGCSRQHEGTQVQREEQTGSGVEQQPVTPGEMQAGGEAAAGAASPVPIDGGVAKLTPENTVIQFVGTHVGPKPDPNARTGRFQQFSGELRVDGSELQAIQLEIDTDSLTAGIPRLTNHLKSPDFFDVRQYPTASFQSTSISSAGSERGMVQVTGDLTLHGITREVSFPATFEVTDAGLTFATQFTIDRTEFGMEFGPDRVEKEVVISVAVGRPLPPPNVEVG